MIGSGTSMLDEYEEMGLEPVCGKCGRVLKPGELKYKVTIDLVSMYDGYIEESDQDVEEEIERLIDALSRQDPEDAAKDVAQTILLVMCRQCRNALVKEYDTASIRIIH